MQDLLQKEQNDLEALYQEQLGGLDINSWTPEESAQSLKRWLQLHDERILQRVREIVESKKGCKQGGHEYHPVTEECHKCGRNDAISYRKDDEALDDILSSLGELGNQCWCGAGTTNDKHIHGGGSRQTN